MLGSSMRRLLVGLTVLSGLVGAIVQAQPVRTQRVDPMAAIPRIGIADFKKLMASGQVVIVDVRGDQAYREGHIPGSISIPLDQVEKKAAELKQSKKTVVTYCT